MAGAQRYRDLQPLPQCHALLLSFEGSGMTNAIARLKDSLDNLGWDVTTHEITGSTSDLATENVAEAMDQFVHGSRSIGTEEDKTLIYYGGHAIRAQGDWQWISGETACSRHAIKVDARKLFKRVIDDPEVDLLLIMHCYVNIYRDTISEYEKSRHRDSHQTPLPDLPKQNVQLMAFPEAAPVTSNCGRRTCAVTSSLPNLSNTATTELAKQLACYALASPISPPRVDFHDMDGYLERVRKYERFIAEEQPRVDNLLRHLTDIASITGAFPQHKPILGLPREYELDCRENRKARQDRNARRQSWLHGDTRQMPSASSSRSTSGDAGATGAGGIPGLSLEDGGRVVQKEEVEATNHDDTHT